MSIASDRAKRERKTRQAPPARGQESLDEYIGEDKYLIRPPKKRRGKKKAAGKKKTKKRTA